MSTTTFPSSCWIRNRADPTPARSRPRFNIRLPDIEKWVALLLPSRSFGFIILVSSFLPLAILHAGRFLMISSRVGQTTSAGIMDHEEARRKHVAGKVLGFVY